MAETVVGDLKCQVIFEPGRLIAGNAGVLVTRVINVKEGARRKFVVVDAGMNDLVRPTLYNAHHTIVTVSEPPTGATTMEVEVVGPICETGDTFGKPRPLPETRPGDLLVVRTAGAYGAVMASTYNARPLVPEVMVSGDEFAVVRERISVDDMLAREALPGWLSGGDAAIREAGE